jgi:hypothetical protein
MMAASWGIIVALIAVLFGATPVSAQCVGVTPAAAGGGVMDPCKTAIAVPEGKGTSYNVGPGQPFKNIGDVPWYKLEPGDTVYIHHRDQPYREKILISGRGNPEQWIRVLGVPGPKGQLPVISGDGAVTSKNMRYRWQDPQVVQRFGVIQLAINSGVDGGGSRLPPGYIEIANLQVQDGFSTYRFTAENGASVAYGGFAACIYARSVQHLVVRNNILTNCGQGFYNWTGDGSGPEWWSALQTNTAIIGNHFYNNGNPSSYLEHQVYTESDRVTIEYNRFGRQKQGALGSQIKDRSVGTVVRYNTIEQSPAGWDIDLVEPEQSWNGVGHKEEYKQAFIYGNVIKSKGVKSPNIIHWNEDHQANRGRATLTGAKLYFYQNTVVIASERGDSEPYTILNATWGGYECPTTDLAGTIDMRNNIIAVLPQVAGARIPPIRLGYCGKEKIELGVNWMSPGMVHKGAMVGVAKIISDANNDPGFMGIDDLRLKPGSGAEGKGGSLAAEVTSNTLKIDLTPTERFIAADRLGPRSVLGQPANLGAY